MEFYQTCEACREQFLASRKQVRFCPRCAQLIETDTNKLESLLWLASETPHARARKESIDEFWQSLTCQEHSQANWPSHDPFECGWDGNRNRIRHNDCRMLIPYVRGFVIAKLKHSMRHKFPGRFPASRKFTPPWLRELNQSEGELSQDPTEIVLKAMFRAFAGGTREQPLTNQHWWKRVKLSPDPEAERLLAEQEAQCIIAEAATGQKLAS